ncbi:MAG: hypothetical protein ABUT20_58435, partial [Bacteroidota bacterium]
MISPLKEQLTAQFYAWELLGRGWLRSSDTIELEPPFTPFFGHYVDTSYIEDDGIRPTLLSNISSIFSHKQKDAPTQGPCKVSYAPYLFDDVTPLQTLQLIIPKQFKSTTDQTEGFLTMLSYCTAPLSYEIIATSTYIRLQFRCRETDAAYIKSQILTFFPGIAVRESIVPEPFNEQVAIAVVDYGLQEEFMRPLTKGSSGYVDLFTAVFSILEHLQKEERVIIQVLCNGVLNHWESSIMASVVDSKGSPFFEDAPEMLPMAKEKV